MGLSYLNNKNWSEITREERFFCAEFYSAIKNNEAKFVKWLVSLDLMNEVPLNPDQEWEIAFEVSFYSDLFNASPKWKSATEAEFSDHRTFDLCLFSEKQIVIIEAKAHEDFKLNQLSNFEDDKQDVPKAIKSATEIESSIDVYVVALASSRYLNNASEIFDGSFSWKDIYDSFSRKNVFLRADEIYKK